jgi:hypothetical protein
MSRMSDEHLRMTESGLIGNDDGPELDPPEASLHSQLASLLVKALVAPVENLGAIERDISALFDDGEDR